MFSESLINQNLSMGGNSLTSSNHPLTSSDSMIKDYCKKEVLELQRQKGSSFKNQQSKLIAKGNILSGQNGITNVEENQTNSTLAGLSQENINDFGFGSMNDQLAKFTNDEESSAYQKSQLSSINSSSAANGNQGRWTKEEHLRFVEGLSLYGKNWKKVEEHVGSRTGAQIRSHAQKFFNKLERDYNKKHGLPMPISLNTQSSSKQSNSINNENLNSIQNNLSLKKSQSCIAPSQTNNSSSVARILSEKNQNNTKNILNNGQQQQIEQNLLFGQQLESSVNQSQQNSLLDNQSFLKKALLSNMNQSTFQQMNVGKSFSQGNGTSQNNNLLNGENFDLPSLIPQLSLRNRSDSVASNFTMLSDDDQKLTDENLKNLKDSLPSMVNQKKTQLSQMNTLQCAVQFLNAYQSMNKSQSTFNQSEQKGQENSYAENANQLYNLNKIRQLQSNKENDVCQEQIRTKSQQNYSNDNLKKQSLYKSNSNQQNIQSEQNKLSESDNHTEYESFFHYIIQRYGKIFDQPQTNNNSLLNIQPRLNQFLNFDGDSSNFTRTNDLFSTISSQPQAQNNFSLQFKNNQDELQGLPNILLKARKSSFTLYDNEDDQKVQKLNVLRKKICTEKENNRTNFIIHPSPLIPKVGKQNSFQTILTQSQNTLPQNIQTQNVQNQNIQQVFRPTQNILINNNDNYQNQTTSTIITNSNINQSSSNSISNIMNPFSVNNSSIADIQSLLDDQQNGGITVEAQE